MRARLVDPARLGRRRSYALGKLAGRASLELHLAQLGIELSEDERARLLERVVALGDRKQRVEVSDLGVLIDGMRGREKRPRVIRAYTVTVDADGVEASLELELAGRNARTSARAGSCFAALIAALHEGAAQLGLTLPREIQIEVRALPKLFEVTISGCDNTLTGVAADQTVAAFLALEKLLQLEAA